MLSAVKSIVASVVVALFGGFLMVGIVTAATTESPSPMTTDTLLPGLTLTIEGVEPGVFHALNDGVRDLARLPIGDWGSGAAVTVDEAGAVWRFVPDRYFRLGAEEEWPIGEDTDLPMAGLRPDGLCRWTPRGWLR